MTTLTHTPLAELPSMDAIKIGPGGQTFGELKQAVLDARAAWMADRSQATLNVYDSAVMMLRAAYVRVGLPYVAP